MGKVVSPNIRRVHTCDACGEKGVWTGAWQQWGSLLASDYGHYLAFCSTKCRTNVDPETKWKEKYGVPSNHKQYKYP